MKVLLSAFEPYAGRARNASQEAIQQLMASRQMQMHRQLEALYLPVEAGRASELVCSMLETSNPDFLVCTGEAKCHEIRLEQVGYNERRYTIADNAGNLYDGTTIVPDGPWEYHATLPLDEMLSAMQSTGVPACLSDDAGRYLCNEVLYASLHFIAEKRLNIQAGFVHIPHLPEGADEHEQPCLATADVVKALVAGLQVLSGL